MLKKVCRGLASVFFFFFWLNEKKKFVDLLTLFLVKVMGYTVRISVLKSYCMLFTILCNIMLYVIKLFYYYLK